MKPMTTAEFQHFRQGALMLAGGARIHSLQYRLDDAQEHNRLMNYWRNRNHSKWVEAKVNFGLAMGAVAKEIVKATRTK